MNAAVKPARTPKSAVKPARTPNIAETPEPSPDPSPKTAPKPSPKTAPKPSPKTAPKPSPKKAPKTAETPNPARETQKIDTAESRKTALISGITGQDGSYLTELLLEKGYIVHGIIRRASSFNTFRIDHLYHNPEILDKQLFLHYGDLTDSSNLNRLIEKVHPDEIYNLGAQSHVQVSFEVPEYTAEVDGIGVLRFLDAIRETGVKTRFYQASTSELFGLVQEVPQRETTPFYPRSPYGAAKLYAYWIVKNYREAYGLFACNGILFNHESERRGKTFVTRKISAAVSNIMAGNQDVLLLGNLDAKRDWGYAPEFVEGMWRMMQADQADDFVLATNETHSIREFVEAAFAQFGVGIRWEGSGVDEVGLIDTVDADAPEVDALCRQAGINADERDKLYQQIRARADGGARADGRKQADGGAMAAGTVPADGGARVDAASRADDRSRADGKRLDDGKRAGSAVVRIHPRYFRPTEVELLIGDSSKAKRELGWEPQITFKELAARMTRADFAKVYSRKQKGILRGSG